MDSVFHRADLAEDMSSRLLDPPPTSSVRSGLFLAAPRRTGKTTFLRRDLVPALENGGALVLYVDLWQERDADPGEVITTAVAAALEKRDGAIRRLARRVATLEEVSVGSVSIALGAAEQGTAGVSLTDALEALSADADRVIVLIVDEAQHLRPEVLEDLRLLTNYEMDSENRLCVLFVGLTELRRRLSLGVHESLDQRIVVRFHLGGLEHEELPAYLAHRLRAASCELPLFEPPAIEAIFQASRALPRRINRLAHYALTAAAIEGVRSVSAEHVGLALAESGA